MQLLEKLQIIRPPQFVKRLTNSRYADRLKGIIRHWPEAAVGIDSFVRFMIMRVGRKTVLLVEPNAFHGVVLPGYYKYFRDLGYEVVLFVRYANSKDSVFCRCVERPRMLVFSPVSMRWALRARKISQFDFVLLTSNQMFDQGVRVNGEYAGYLGLVPRARYGVFHVEHSFFPDEQIYSADFDDMFLLTRRTYNGGEVPMLNPHWFGNVSRTPLNQGKRVFIAVGEVKNKNCSIPLLLEAVRQLEKWFDFEVWLVGGGADALLAEALPKSVRTFGYQPFKEMFELMEHADFMLPLLDPKYDAHKRYLKGITSGACLLILGFSKVPLIHSDFAKVYGFSENDSILHGDDRIEQAMERALTMTEEEYADLQQSLQILERDVYNESLENLKQKIEDRSSTV